MYNLLMPDIALPFILRLTAVIAVSQLQKTKRDILATGGGPSQKPTLDPVLQVVEDAAPSLDISITCPWDSTALFEIERNEARCKPTEDIVGELVIGATVSMCKFCYLRILELIVLNEVFTADTERKCIPLPLPSHIQMKLQHPVIETPTAMSKLRNRRSIAVASVSKEKDARVQKLNQATEQQELLFNLRKQILEEELQREVDERAAAKKKAELKFQKAAETLDQKLKRKLKKEQL
ncbi:hypothetical protein FQA39_LY05014 [Lamprigera yunnana]|nr:hypothetical protein FQA39_LY05014 [Lamprigera yunnana]